MDSATHLTHFHKRWKINYGRYNCKLLWSTSTMLSYFAEMQLNTNCMFSLYCRTFPKQFHLEPYEVQLLHWKDWITWAFNSVRKLEAGWLHHWRIKPLGPLHNRIELKSLLGLCEVYRRIVPHFAGKAAPLNNKSKRANHGRSMHLCQRSTKHQRHTRWADIRTSISLTTHREQSTFDPDACDKQVSSV